MAEVKPSEPIDEIAHPPAQAESKAEGTEPVQEGEPEGGDMEGDDDEPVVAPTTRSKTAPHRRQPTPPAASPSPPTEIKRGVITLSDVHAARAALAEKANAHWVKGLGGGQNKEGETIVQFLYKMKAGPGRSDCVRGDMIDADPFRTPIARVQPLSAALESVMNSLAAYG